MSALVPFNEQERMAEVIAKSGMFGLKDTTAVLALMAVAQAEGRHPASVAKDYHMIQGRPALKADAMLARFQQAGGSVQWTTYKDEQVSGIFSHPQGGSLEVTWTLAQAKAIGLATKDNWKLYRETVDDAVISTQQVEVAVAALKEIKAQIKDLESKEEQVTVMLQNYMRDKTAIVTPYSETLVTWKAAKESRSFDSKLFAREMPDLYEKFVVTKPGARRFLVK